MKTANYRNFGWLLRLCLLGLLNQLIFLLLSLSVAIFALLNSGFRINILFFSLRTRLLCILLVFLRQYQIIGILRLIILLLRVNN